MEPEPPADAPKLTAWIDTDGEDDQLHIVVSENGQVYDRVETHIGVLAANNQIFEAFERPPITLVTLYNRQVNERTAGDGPEPDAEIEAPPEA